MIKQRTYIAHSKRSGTVYISQRAIKESFRPPFSKSAEPTGNLHTHIAKPKPSGALYISQRATQKSFGQAFSKACRFSGRRPESSVATDEIPYRSKNAGEGEFLCKAKKEGEPSSGVLPYLWLVCSKTKREDNILPYIIFTICANIVR